jgi:thymidine kinase
MFSGKTEELIRRLRRALIAQQNVRCFKPAKDDRYAVESIVSHQGITLESTPVVRPKEILDLIDDDTEVIGIDEVQFFPESVIDVCEHLAHRGVRVICAGLDQDYRGQPFGPMPHLMAVAEYVTKALAICMVCGNPAGRSYRVSEAEAQVLIGAGDHYEPRCRACYRAGNAERKKQTRISEVD